MTTSVGSITHTRGESVSFGIRADDPQFTGAETVTCDIKLAVNGNMVPPETAAVIVSATPAYSAAVGDVPAQWLFSLTPLQTALLPEGDYITDCKIVLAGGAVDYPAPLSIKIAGRVTA